ncbi:GNAT family N-acetyltransferase [Metabacillus halosaccharovorans]|uniref:GNAT family N-acetyltransferase n=1 Tax=Metabacillus halosaccharovorans TaxID=930124 RepID=A0ABT3DAW7_9BACI|nr:GNAT family N-acetyltransferase [Metabacillus halosaccharovorans]MCV9884195.1 GNAT family N-acetyltransferase [Metabacillus halosaccharovorans]
MEIKIAIDTDIPVVYTLMLEAFEEYRTFDVPSSALNESLEALQKAVKSNLEKALLCSINGVPVGSCRFTMKEDTLYFSRLSVTPLARGKGIAKAMLLWLEKYAYNHSIGKIECRVRVSLPKNISLYKSLGYSITKEEAVTNPNGILVNTVVMEKTLINSVPL